MSGSESSVPSDSPFRDLPHPRALAFLGDSVYELKIRAWAVASGLSHSRDLHAFTTAKAKATMQVALLHHIKPELTEAEWELVRQGRNVGVSAGRRSDQSAHRQATGLEALIGGLYLANPQRLAQLWTLMQAFLASPEAESAAKQAAHGIGDRP